MNKRGVKTPSSSHRLTRNNTPHRKSQQLMNNFVNVHTNSRKATPGNRKRADVVIKKNKRVNSALGEPAFTPIFEKGIDNHSSHRCS